MRQKLTIRLLLVGSAVIVFINLAFFFKAKPIPALENNRFLRILVLPSLYTKELIRAAENSFRKFTRLTHAHEELEELKKKYGKLQAENTLLKAKLDGLERQSVLEGHKKKYPFPMEVTKVIGRNPLFWHQYLLLEGGKDRGFESGMPVITKDGLVGKITEVYDESSKMILIIDPDFSVDVRGEKSQVLALCSGIGTSVMKINYVPRFEDLSAGETLTTSGLDGSFPEGIPVGYLVEINKPFGAYFLDAYVIPVIDVLKVRDVMVIKDFKKKR